MDAIDLGCEAEQAQRDLILLAHSKRAQQPLPLCEECADAEVVVTHIGVRLRYCSQCAYDLTGRTVV